MSEVVLAQVPPAPRCELVLIPSDTSRSPEDGYGYGSSLARIKNDGESRVTLVMPHDRPRLRTPVIAWSILPADSPQAHPVVPPGTSVGGNDWCGTRNPLKLDDILTLNPGESKVLRWVCLPHETYNHQLEPGKYRVVLYYSNNPDLGTPDIRLSDEEVEVMRRIQCSTPITLVSNEVIIEIPR